MKRNESGGMTAVLLACCGLGAVAMVATLSVPKTRGVPNYATEEYGRKLIAETPAWLGPDVADPAMRYTRSRLACGSCHLGAGTVPGTLTLLETKRHYPRFSGRVGAKTDIEDRINECMQRSMNGKPLPADSPEMTAMAAYLRSLGALAEALGPAQTKAKEPAAFRAPERAANLEAGQKTFAARCAACHGLNGQGLPASTDLRKGYVFPPLWGADSFNNGAGMHRVLTAARFVKARMPLGNPTLSDEEAFDVAAYFNAQVRPEMANLAADYPDRSAKPVDNPYGPFVDAFPLRQHRIGPFGPIVKYYKKLKAGK